MADVYRDGTLYNVGKAIKNGNEYLFDWTMLNEYNQLVSYYDTVKGELRTAIINKGVDVPASASINDYPSYINQINSIDVLSGVSLNNIRISGYATTPSVTGVVSWNNGGLLYGLCCTTLLPRDSDTYYYGIHTFRKITANSDIIYEFTTNNSGQSYRYCYPTEAFEVYLNGDNVRVFSFSSRARSGDGRYWSFCYQFDWNTSTGGITTNYLGTGTYGDYNYINYGGDATGFTKVTGSSWVDRAVGNLPDYGSVYLVLK